MKRSFFSKVFLCLLAVSVCVIGSVFAENVAVFVPPDLSKVIEIGTPVLAMGTLVIPAYQLDNLKCVTQEVYQGLHAKYGKLYVIDVNIDEDESYQFLLRRPTRQHLEIIGNYEKKGDYTKVNEFTVKNLVVAGNENDILENDGVVFGQFNIAASKIVKQGQSFLGKA